VKKARISIQIHAWIGLRYYSAPQWTHRVSQSLQFNGKDADRLDTDAKDRAHFWGLCGRSDEIRVDVRETKNLEMRTNALLLWWIQGSLCRASLELHLKPSMETFSKTKLQS